MATARLLFALLVGALLFAACSSDPGEQAAVETSTTTVAPTTSTTTTTELEVVTTIRRVPASELASEGTINIGATEYGFAFECYAAGAGDILALGIGEDPVTGVETQAIVQAFFGQAYVAVLIGDEQVNELAVDAPADLFVQGDEIRGSALRFVDASGAPGVGEQLGLGTVSVDCQGFAPGLPEGYTLS